MMTFSQVIEQERRRWMPFRQALPREDQAEFDRLFECAKEQLKAEIQLGRPWGFELVLMAVMLEHEKRIQEMVSRLEELSAGKA